MNDDALRRLIEERWTALEVEQATGERRQRVSQLPIATKGEPLAVAVDHDGHHHLLVPIHAHRKIRPGLAGPVLQLRKRALEDEETYQTYADLTCLRSDLNDLFTELCVDVLGAAEDLPENPVKALYRVLDRWKALFRTQGTPLGPDQLSGLFGELIVLNRLLKRDPSAHRLWRGPEGHRHDFSAGTTAVEVKSSTASEGRRPRIHGLDQLEVPEGGTLPGLVPPAPHSRERCRHRFRGGGGPGTSSVRRRGCATRSACRSRIPPVRRRPLPRCALRGGRGEVVSSRPRIPRSQRAGELSAAGVPVSVLDVEYTIDLSGEAPAPLAHDQVSQAIDSMIQESV